MNVIEVSVLLFIGIFIIILLREVSPGYVLPLTVAVSVFVLTQVLPLVSQIWSYSDSFISKAVSDPDIALLYKAVGTAFLVQYVSDISRENGIESLASKAEFIGKIYITSLCIPLIERIISSVSID